MPPMSAQSPNPSPTQDKLPLGLRAIFSAFWYSAQREWQFLRGHRWDFALMFWLPLLLIALVWWIFSKGTLAGVPVAVIDHSHSPQSATLIRYIDATPEVDVIAALPDTIAAKRAIERTQIFGVVDIPEDFSRRLFAGEPTRVLLDVNAQFGTHSGMVQKGVQTAVATFSAGAELRRRVAQGDDVSLIKSHYAPIQTQSIGLFNTANNYQQFLAVTAIPALLHILSMVIGASVMGRELRDKTLGDWYACFFGGQSSSVQSPSVHGLRYPYGQNPSIWLIIAGLNGKLIWAMLAYALWGAVALTLVTQLYAVSMASLAVTYATFLLFMMLSFWMGVIVTVGTFSYRQGLSFTGFISAPSFAFSGVTFPLIAMSPAAERWANALPLTHYLKVQTPQLQMAAPPSYALSACYGFMLAVLVSLLLSAVLAKKALLTPDKWGKR